MKAMVANLKRKAGTKDSRRGNERMAATGETSVKKKNNKKGKDISSSDAKQMATSRKKRKTKTSE